MDVPPEPTSTVRTEASSSLSESARLVRDIAAGQPDAERQFALRYMPPVKAMLTARLRDADLASDIKQDVMIEALCALRRGQIQDPEKLTQFVLGIARNCLNNYFRSSKRVAAVELPDDIPDLKNGAFHREEIDQENRALRAIENLDKLDRAILQMTLVDGLKPGVIATQLHINPDVVRQRKLRATRRVIDFLKRESQNSPGRHIQPGRAS
ncbi:RNA polymerase sigma factor [Occallatibacter riparius]|uniref:Sigma-70 family RNA polymerase sigma factor n=1 Tax=Occallatibacter riparius TaxID=1002689 RepID=A0A9J7BNK9_9BACT|nr:sigma-70 family RNA polymerase sigma factor [Occallatibacter riparius]UWZ84476.1 sigma-70 family RNA polymerase sigma factor [Occallatibacter riparius]